MWSIPPTERLKTAGDLREVIEFHLRSLACCAVASDRALDADLKADTWPPRGSAMEGAIVSQESHRLVTAIWSVSRAQQLTLLCHTSTPISLISRIRPGIPRAHAVHFIRFTSPTAGCTQKIRSRGKPAAIDLCINNAI